MNKPFFMPPTGGRTNRPVQIGDKTYDSIQAAARSLNIEPRKVREGINTGVVEGLPARF